MTDSAETLTLPNTTPTKPRRPPRIREKLVATSDIVGYVFVSAEDVQHMTGLSSGAIRQAVAAGTFPAPRQLTERRVAWRSDEVTAWMNDRPKAGGPDDPVAGDDAASPEARAA